MLVVVGGVVLTVDHIRKVMQAVLCCAVLVQPRSLVHHKPATFLLGAHTTPAVTTPYERTIASYNIPTDPRPSPHCDRPTELFECETQQPSGPPIPTP